MIKVLVTTVCVLAAALCCGQYTYFNNYYTQAGYDPLYANGCTNLIVKDSLLLTAGIFGNSYDSIQRFHHMVDMSGQLQNELHIPLGFSDFYYTQYGDNFRQDGENYYSAVGYYNDSLTNTIPGFYYFNSSLEQQWFRSFPQFQSDSVYLAHFHASTVYQDNTFIAAGDVGLEYDGMPGIEMYYLILSKFSEDSVYWVKQYPISSVNSLFPTESIAIRVSELTLLNNGDFLLWGGWAGPWDPMVMRFNSEGEYLAEKHWGNPELDDWCALPVQLNDSLFMFSNMQAIDYVDQWSNTEVEKPLVGLFNANQMDTAWTKIYDHPLAYTFIYDFEKTDDGGYVVLGQGINLTFDAQFVYMMKVDSEGNELWYHSYAPPVEEFTTAVGYDLEVTPDGGLAFVGEFRTGENLDISPTWLVKTDACGDEVFNGCPVGIDEGRHPELVSGSLHVWPNPSNAFVNITSEQEFVSITIRDITGKLVYTSAMSNHVLQTQVDVSTLAQGLYLIEADFGNGHISAQRLDIE